MRVGGGLLRRHLWTSRRCFRVVRQQQGSGSKAYEVSDKGGWTERKTSSQKSIGEHANQILKNCVEHLLPRDYESSVGATYGAYVRWTMGASVIGTVSGVLSMQALLFAVGLGQGSIPAAAAVNWVLKDGLGQLGGVLFASAINQRFDAEPKRWRFKSAAVLDASILLEVLTPWFPNHFLLIASLANIGKNIGWLSASATRAGIHRSFMRVENLADITGKAGSQSIAASVVGTGLGIGLSSLLGHSTGLIFGASCVLSSLHLGCTYMALKTVTIRNLNLQRFWIALRPCLSYDVDEHGHIGVIRIDASKVLSPDEVAPKETFLHLGQLSARRFGHSVLEQDQAEADLHGFASSTVRLRIGSDIPRAFPDGRQLVQALNEVKLKSDKHILTTTMEPVGILKQREAPVLHLLMVEQATSQDTIRALVHAILAHQLLVFHPNARNDNGTAFDAPHRAREFFSEADLESLLVALRAKGWDTDYTFFEPFHSRVFLD